MGTAFLAQFMKKSAGGFDIFSQAWNLLILHIWKNRHSAVVLGDDYGDKYFGNFKDDIEI